MIHESQIKKAYGSNPNVIRKGDKGWTSDAGRETEAALADPRMQRVGYQRKLTARVERDYGEHIEAIERFAANVALEVGDRVGVADGPDRLTFEYRGPGQWRLCFRERNAAL